MFAPWRSQNPLRMNRDPITGNSFINLRNLASGDIQQIVDKEQFSTLIGEKTWKN